MIEVVLRVVVSLGLVLGLFWAVARVGSRRLGGNRDRALVRVRSRQALSRGSSLAVVEVGSRVLVVGVSDSGVRLLTEMDPAELEPVLVASAVAPAVASIAAVVDEDPVEDFASAYDAAFAAAYAGTTVPDEILAPHPAPHAVPHLVEPADLVESWQQHAAAVPAAAPAAAPRSEPAAALAARHATRSATALRGSLLDTAVWKDAWASATGRAHRDGDAA